MAALSNDRQGSPPQWNILIVAEDHPEFNKNYAVPSNTCLGYIKERWMEDCDTMEYWVFISADRTVEYDESLSLESIGEVIVGTGIVTLRAKLSDEPRPTNEIFVCLKDECHHLQVKPNDKLNDVLRDLKGRPATIECNGMPLNPQETVKQSGIENKAVICGHRRQSKVSVKLSSGVTRIVKLPEDSLVLRLFEMVSRYEDNDFSLTYQGRSLNKDESIRKLEHVVEVAQAEFTVNINNQRVSWKTRGSAMSFPDFLSQLSSVGHMDRQKLEMMQFFCVGCRRCISLSDEDVQLLPVQCCKEQSLTLDVKSPIEAETQLEKDGAEYFYELFNSFNETLINSKSMDSTEEDPRGKRKLIKEKCLHEGLDFNKLTQICEKLQIHIAHINDKLNTLELNSEKLKDENLKSSIQIKMSIDESTKFAETIKSLRDEKANATFRIQTLEDERKKAFASFDTLKEENSAATAKIRALKIRISQAAVETRTLKEENSKILAENQKLKKPEAPVEDHTVTLLILYEHDCFTAVAARPEIKCQGRYHWHDSISHIKCQMPCLRPGWSSFEDVRDALRPLVTGRPIRRIDQLRGSANGKTVAEVTSRTNDERERCVMDIKFCDDHGGLQVSWQEAGEPDWQEIREGGRLLICGGLRRTVLQIFTA